MHLIYVADVTGLEDTAARLGSAIGVQPVPGGVHTTFGTCNAILPLAGLVYLEVVAVHDPGTAARSPFGNAVAASSAPHSGGAGDIPPGQTRAVASAKAVRPRSR